MKGILMKPDMIQAVVEGRKTNTRRAETGLKEINQEPDAWELLPGHESDSLVFLFRHKELSEVVSTKPRYHAGETVYIKEAYALGGEKFPLRYKLDGADAPWQNPLFMPYTLARHFITITDVRAERLQEITYVDILAEGWNVRNSQPFTDRTAGEDAKDWFKDLWNSINPKYPWESNPWVFPYTFERHVPERMADCSEQTY